MVTNFQEAKLQNRQALRRGLLDAAGRVLVNEGFEALTMRRVAQEVSASTKVLYTLFGSKEGLLEQLYVEGFERLHSTMLAVPTSDDPLTDLTKVADAYRQNALTNPTYFAVLFGRATASFKPSAESVQEAALGFAVLQGCVERALAAGLFAPTDPEMAAKALWSSIHGAISLELDGYFDDHDAAYREQIYQMALAISLRGLSRAAP